MDQNSEKTRDVITPTNTAPGKPSTDSPDLESAEHGSLGPKPGTSGQGPYLDTSGIKGESVEADHKDW